MALPLIGLWPWLVGLVTSAFTSFATFLIGRMVYEKAVHYALVTAFVVAAGALTVGLAASLKAAIFAVQIGMPNSLGAATYFLPSNINIIFGMIITIRVSNFLYRWTMSTMAAYVPNNPNYLGRY